MPIIYMDESGDLGFDLSKPGTSRNFIITFVAATNKKVIDKMVKKIFSKMTKKELKHHSGTLHAYKELDKTKVRLLQYVEASDDLSIMYIQLNKQKVYANLQDEKHVLYNYITNILLDRIFSKRLIKTLDKQIELVVEQRETNTFLNENFQAYLHNKMNQNGLAISIKITKPHAEKGLQVADVVSWSIFRALERGDEQYKDIINPRVVEGSVLFGH